MFPIHNPALRAWIEPDYGAEALERLQAFLAARGVFDFKAMPTGLYPAAALPAAAATETGYGNVWVRDNIHVAHALEVSGRADLADRTVRALAKFYADHSARFYDIVAGGRSQHVPMHRPHIRFNGAELVESAEIWPHAQNDALGLFLWFYAKRALGGAFAADFALLEMFALYFETIAYWRDADNGHWEERAKIEASSIGCIVAALRLVIDLRAREKASPWRRGLDDARLAALLRRGEDALDEILPWECRGSGDLLARRYDSALLFLCHPLEAVAPDMARQLAEETFVHLGGEHGVRRYLGDSYWTADYKAKVAASQRTSDFSLKQSERDKLAQPGEEAQWCLFDPVLSILFGKFHLQTGARADRERQIFHFNRALGQITGPECPAGAFKCPEAYYLENGVYVANDHTPLLWSQANLLAAFAGMKATLSRDRTG